MMGESNAFLAQRYQEQDEIAFAKLFGRHHSLVFNICLRILGHRQDAEDATQETFSRMAQYIDRWDTSRPLEPWLAVIAGNRCRSLLAKKRVHQSLSTTAEPLSDEADSNRAADSLREEVLLALAALPDCQRRAFHLFHDLGLSYAEIAVKLQSPIGTVKTWVHRARGNVIRHLQQREVVSGIGLEDAK